MPRTTRALGALLCLTALAGCSGGGSTATPSAPAGASSSAGSATEAAAATPKVGDTVTGAELSATLRAAMDAAPNATLALTSPGGGAEAGSAKGLASYAEAGSTLSLEIAAGSGGSAADTIDVIHVPGAIYVKTGGEPLPGGKEWAKITDLSEPGLFSGLLGTVALSMSAFTNPDSLVRVVKAAPTLTVTQAGAQGITYTTTLNPKQAVELYPADLFTGNPQARTEVSKQSTDTGGFDLTLTVDAKGLPTAISWDAVSQGEKVKVAVTYTGWGPGEAVAEPAAGKTVDAAELDKGLTS